MLIDLDYQPTEEEKRASEKRWNEFICNYKFAIYYIRYKNTENPLYAWGTYHLCRKMNIPFPEWVLDYFDEVAQNLKKPQEGGERIGVFLQKALKMNKKGRGNIFQRLFDTERKIDTVWEILELLREKKTLEDALCQISGRTGKSEETLKKWYYQYRTFLIKLF